MKWVLACTLLIVTILPSAGPSSLPASGETDIGPEREVGSLLALLPDSTLVAAELHDLDRRWSEIRAVPAVAAFQNRLLDGSGLEPDDLPILTGNRAALALVPIRGGRTAIPIAVLRPTDLDRAEAILDVRAGAPSEVGAAWCRVRARSALWVGPANAADELDAVARGNGTSLGSLLPAAEAAKRLPEGGLVRGWVNPEAARDYFRGMPERTLPDVGQWIAAAAAAKMDATRWIAFRRDILGNRLVTDGFIAYDLEKLPAPVARVLVPDASQPPPPSSIPDDVVLAASFRTEADACLPWLRFLGQADRRGPFRNLEFWIEEFQEQSGLSLQRELFGSLDEHAWELLLESRGKEGVQWAAVFEASDPRRIEATLLALRDWLAGHASARSLGLARLRPKDYRHHGTLVHGSRIATLLGGLTGPAFAATDEHVVVGIGDRAVFTALDLVSADGFSAEPVPDTDPPAHASFVVRGPSLARSLARFFKADTKAMTAVKEFLVRIREASVHVRYEKDGLRVHGEVEPAISRGPRSWDHSIAAVRDRSP